MHAHGDVAAASPPAAVNRRLRVTWPRTLRGKGVLALAAALVYSLAAAVDLTVLRGVLQSEVLTLQSLHRYERALARAEVAVSSANLEVQEATFAQLGSDFAPTRSSALVIEGALRALADLEPHDAGAVRSVRSIARSQSALEKHPVRAAWLDLRDTLRRVQEEVAIQRDRTAQQRQDVSERYQEQFDTVTRHTYLLLLVGLGVFGAAVVMFFTRLTRDIVRLQVRASDIVRGERQPPLTVERADELGQLTHAVNRMADDLESRARQLELEDQRRAHQEKMATLGALAASVAHEVNNPLMTIAGVAQELAATASDLSGPDAARRGKLLLDEVQRLANVTRQIADVAAPHSADMQWLDLNAMVRPMLHFVRYDKRYRGIDFQLALDPQLPAARALGDPVELVVLRLLNEMAAAAAGRSRRGAQLIIRTQSQSPTAELGIGAAVELAIVDPGAALEPGGLAPADNRALKVCRSIVESLGGRLLMQRDLHGVCAVSLRLPAAEAAAVA